MKVNTKSDIAHHTDSLDCLECIIACNTCLSLMLLFSRAFFPPLSPTYLKHAINLSAQIPRTDSYRHNGRPLSRRDFRAQRGPRRAYVLYLATPTNQLLSY